MEEGVIQVGDKSERPGRCQPTPLTKEDKKIRAYFVHSSCELCGVYSNQEVVTKLKLREPSSLAIALLH